MGGSTVPGVNSNEDGVQRPEDDKLDVVAAAAQRMAQNDPRFDQEPVLPPEPAVMAGLTAAQIGLNATSSERLRDPTAPENRPTQIDPQTLKNTAEDDISVFTGNSMAAQKLAYDIETSGGGGSISGRLYDGVRGEDGLTDQERKDKNAYYDSMLMAGSWDQMMRDSDSLGAECDRMQPEVNQALSDARDARAEVAAELDSLRETKTQQEAELKALQDQRVGKSGAELAALEAQIADKQRELNATNERYDAYREMAANMTLHINDAQEKYDAASKNIKDLQERMKTATGEEKIQLEAQLKQAKQDLNDARVALADVKHNAQLTRETLTMARDGNLDANEVAKLHQMSQDNPTFQAAATSLIMSLTKNGMTTVTADDGSLITGPNATDYLLTKMGIAEVDTARYQTEKALAANPNDPALASKLEALNDRRFELEQQAQACIVDTAADLRMKESPELQRLVATQAVLADLTAPNVVLDGVNGDAVVLKDKNGDLQIQYASGGEIRTEAVKDQPNAAELTQIINAQLAAGKTLGATPEITSAQLAVGAASIALLEAQIKSDTYQQYAAERYAKENSTAVASETVTSGDKEWKGDEKLALSIPDPQEEERRNLEKAQDTIAAFANNNPGGTMSASTVDELRRLVGYAAVEQMMEKEGVKADNSILGEFGLGINSPVRAAMTAGFGLYLFDKMSEYMQGIQIPTFSPQENIAKYGVRDPYAGMSFADGLFNETNPVLAKGDAPMSYMVPGSFMTGAAMLASAFGFGGPAQGPSPEEQVMERTRQLELEQQRILAWQRQQAELTAMQSPKPPSQSA